MYSNITTIEAAFAARGLDYSAIDRFFDDVHEAYRDHLKDEYMIAVVTDALNGDKVVDWSDTTQVKYSVWWWIQNGPSGPGLSDYDFDYSNARAGVGARHVVLSREAALHVKDHFQALFERYYFRKRIS